MGTNKKLCGLVGFIGLFGILTASCATAEPPSGSPDDDDHIGVARQAFSVICYGRCNNSEIVSGGGAEYSAMECAMAYARGTVVGYCGTRGGLQEFLSCT